MPPYCGALRRATGSSVAFMLATSSSGSPLIAMTESTAIPVSFPRDPHERTYASAEVVASRTNVLQVRRRRRGAAPPHSGLRLPAGHGDVAGHAAVRVDDHDRRKTRRRQRERRLDPGIPFR